MVRVILGRVLMIGAGLLGMPWLVSLIYREPAAVRTAYLGGVLLMAAVGGLLQLRPPEDRRFYVKEGFMITAIAWCLLSLLGALPMYWAGDFPTYIDALFETTSGLSTTGATVAIDVEALSRATLFWRAFSHLIGGMGVLVFALALVPKLQAETVHVLQAEVPGPRFSKLVAGIGSTARLLYLIYLTMTAVLVGLLILLGMPAFDAMIHAFSTAGTGGFGMKNASIAHYDLPAVEYVLTVAMFLFGVNFNLYYLLLIGRFRSVARNEELRAYLLIAWTAAGLILLNVAGLYRRLGEGLGTTTRHILFTVSSIMTSTGFTTVDYTVWPGFAQGILILLMFVGGSAGSTAGGLKVSRILVLAKTARAELHRVRHPRRLLRVTLDERRLPLAAVRATWGYLAMYTALFAVITILLLRDTPDITTAFSATLSSLNNMGPGFSAIGPAYTYAPFSPFSKVLLSAAMLIGRLEIWPVLMLFSRETWRKV